VIGIVARSTDVVAAESTGENLEQKNGLRRDLVRRVSLFQFRGLIRLDCASTSSKVLPGYTCTT
jgi:hypothetical protein